MKIHAELDGVKTGGPPLFLGRECVGGLASNGRHYYTTQVNGLQMCQVYSDEAATLPNPWGEVE